MLGPRILKPKEPALEDYEQWRSCLGRGKTIPIYKQKFESEIEDVVECKRKPDMQKLKERIEREEDNDIRRELRMGHSVETMDDNSN